MNNGSAENDIMTASEVSEFLQLALSTIYRLTQEGQLPARKIGGTWRYSRRQLVGWIEEGMRDETKAIENGKIFDKRNG